MFFKLTAIVKPLYLTEGEKICIDFIDDGDAINLVLQKMLKEEMPQLYQPGCLLCTAIIELKLDEQLQAEFKGIIQETPKNVNSKLSEIEKRLSKIIDSMIYNFRWKFGVENSYNPILFKYGPSWSFDKLNWIFRKELGATTLGISFGFPVLKEYSQPEVDLLRDLLAQKIEEPLGHELFSEAWEIRTNNPRSSLVIGIAALEAGFAECVSLLVPDARWLINKVPSPPLVDMLKNYLPLLPCRNKIYGQIVPPPNRNILDAAYKNRNQIAHGRSSTFIEGFDLEEFLRSVRDILYLLDYYCGHTWAFNHIRSKVGDEIISAAKAIT